MPHALGGGGEKERRRRKEEEREGGRLGSGPEGVWKTELGLCSVESRRNPYDWKAGAPVMGLRLAGLP